MVQDFSRNYSPPGVYISESQSTVVTTYGIPPTLVALVGPAIGYQSTTEQVVLDSANQVQLLHQNIDAASIVISDAITGSVLDPTDYTVTQDQTSYSQLLGGANLNGTTPVVFVSYNYTDFEYYNPKSFDNFEDVKKVYGEPLNLNVNQVGVTYQYVISPLSLGAMVAFQNGATEVVLCAATPPPGSATSDSAKSTARKTALAQAYAKLGTDPNVNVVVPITTGIATSDAPTAMTDLKNYVDGLAINGFFQFGVIGFDPEMITPPDNLLATSSAKDKRVMLAYANPAGLLMYSGGSNSNFPVGHQYLAAAYAGKMAAQPVQYSLTRQTFSGFSGLAGVPLTTNLKNNYSSAGVAVTEKDRYSQLVCRHGVTTDSTNVNTREASVVRARDALVTSLSSGMENSGLIGSPLTEDTLLSVKSAVSGILELATSTSTINAYTALAVRISTGDPTVVEVQFAYKPAYPLNYIAISFSIDLSSGLTTTTDLAA